MNPNGTYITKDLDLAAYLHARDVKIVDVRKNEVNKTIFIFADGSGLAQKMSLEFYNHDDQISASRLLWSYQQMKTLLFDPNLDKLNGTKATVK